MVCKDYESIKECIRLLESTGKLRIVYENFTALYGLVYKGRYEQYLIVINSNLCVNIQRRIFWHEAKHIYSHVMQEGDYITFEEEAIEFAEYAATLESDLGII